MTENNPTAVHIKALVDSGCTLDPAVISGMFQAERAVALRAFAAEVKATMEDWFSDVSLDDLYLVKGWAIAQTGLAFPPGEGGEPGA